MRQLNLWRLDVIKKSIIIPFVPIISSFRKNYVPLERLFIHLTVFLHVKLPKLTLGTASLHFAIRSLFHQHNIQS